jgi:hypothetical protein
MQTPFPPSTSPVEHRVPLNPRDSTNNHGPSHFVTRSEATPPYFVGIGNPELQDDLHLFSPSIHDAHGPSCTLRHEEPASKIVTLHSDALTLNPCASADETFVSPQPDLLDDFLTMDVTQDVELSLGSKAWEEETLSQSLVNDSLSVPQSSPGLAFGPSSYPTSPPRQTYVETAAQNNMGFQSPPLMPPQMMMQPHVFSNMIFGGTTLYLPINVPATRRTPCTHCTETFARPSDLDRHWQSVHLGIKHHCFWLGCPNNRGKGYCRLEKLRTHQRKKHGFA